ncbi:unnamed protein product [Clonostachys byssicola]|uniref:Beta-galactosidase n=1 Tax=Clonostachys byssicola TaxID=160290 RepID=A0A9N9UYJ4_9HYPO|nr:unnamed protein product [Clonostachys byssicola]
MLISLQSIKTLLLHVLACGGLAETVSGEVLDLSPRTNASEIVTWDEYSVMIRGERIMFYSGEVHPFRLPSPGSWLDVFQKIKAAGFTGVSFYLMWALLEGEPGHVRTDGVFALEEFFRAASDAGIYLLARPGPYINAETSGGGFPGWVQRVSGLIRSNNPKFTEIIRPYLSHVGQLIADAQVSNGGPVILVQPENEYSICSDYTTPESTTACLEPEYMATVEEILREAGVNVPFISNDVAPVGNWAPGSSAGAVDIYGIDVYPLDWSSGCMDPQNWKRGHFPLDRLNFSLHNSLSPNTPFSVVEGQGGAADFWGGVGVDVCAEMVDHKFARVFNKFLYGMRATVLNLYMMFGGTNWGNLGHPKGYTSYDTGAAISENRLLGREKYYELKLQGFFLQSSPSYLISHPDDGTLGEYTDTDTLMVNRLKGEETTYYVTRHAQYDTMLSQSYYLTVPTKLGQFKVPQLGGSLTLEGRDSKIHVTDYPVGNTTLIYSTAEILAWRGFPSKTVLLLYGSDQETHEFALPRGLGCPTVVEGPPVKCQPDESISVINAVLRPGRRVLRFNSSLEIYLLERSEAYKYWVVDVPAPPPVERFTSPSRLASTELSVIVRGGYLIRSATFNATSLYLSGDVNSTTEIEIVGAPRVPEQLFFNGKAIETLVEAARVTGIVQYTSPNITLPTLSQLHWHHIDSLPEISAQYNDENWIICNKLYSNNTRNLTTPTSLYAGDYGFHSGSLLYRGHFNSSGGESSFSILTQGGDGFGHSVWLDSIFLGSWVGSAGIGSRNQTFDFSEKLEPGTSHVLTILIDHMGLRDNWEADGEGMREPHGILEYALRSSCKRTDISWRMTGNIGGESYLDHSRGPLNEGAMFAERSGLHLPGAPFTSWEKGSPLQGLDQAGVHIFGSAFNLSLPTGYDIPISLNIANITHSALEGGAVPNFRVQIFLNGWQVGKYISNLGPQSRYVLPEGILNHHGMNYLALTLWSLDETGAKLGGFTLEVDGILQSGKKPVSLVTGSGFTERPKGLY